MISLIVTNYKTWDLTQRCVKSVDQTDTSKQITEIVIVDDYSEESIPSYIKEHGLITVITNKENKGYAKSVNIGFNAASNNICLLLDSDAYLIENVHLVIDSFNNNPKLGLLGFRLVDENGSKTGNGESEANIWNLILGQQLESVIKKVFSKNTSIKSLYSCAIGVRKASFLDVNGFDETFDFLDADHDFSMKINRSNWELQLNNDVIIYHKGGGSPQYTSKRVIRFYKNRFRLLKKHNLIPYENLIKFLVKTRLYTELFILNTIGRVKYPKSVFEDKIYSRRQIIEGLRTF